MSLSQKVNAQELPKLISVPIWRVYRTKDSRNEKSVVFRVKINLINDAPGINQIIAI